MSCPTLRLRSSGHPVTGDLTGEDLQKAEQLLASPPVVVVVIGGAKLAADDAKRVRLYYRLAELLKDAPVNELFMRLSDAKGYVKIAGDYDLAAVTEHLEYYLMKVSNPPYGTFIELTHTLS